MRPLSLLGNLLLLVLVAAPASAKTYVRWTNAQIPPPNKLGVRDLVVPWTTDAPELAQKAWSRGYRVFIEAERPDVDAVEQSAVASRLSGIAVRVGDLDATETQTALNSLRHAYPHTKFLLLLTAGKEPRMKGHMVFERNGILAVSSPTSQPWVDSNLALVRYARMRFPSEPPLYTFAWDLSGPLDQKRGPSAQDYALAVCEAAALHADLVLPLHESLQSGLGNNQADAWKIWSDVRSAMRYKETQSEVHSQALADVIVATDSYAKSVEPINLLSRHNLPLRVISPSDLATARLTSAKMLVTFSPFDAQEAHIAQVFAKSGGIVVLVDSPGSYPWHSLTSSPSAEHATSYSVGKGKIIELAEPVIDPETFSQNVRGLLGSRRPGVSLWNSLTTLVVPYRDAKSGGTVLELVDYSEEPADVQVRVKGEFASVRYQTPADKKLNPLTSHFRDGFTEFVIPPFQTAARVYLESLNSE